MAEAGEKPGSGEALVSFSTKLPEKYQVQDDSLVVPASLKRFGLSEVVNRLLGFDKPVPFDFLVNGEFLRVDLYTYLESHKLSSEQVLKLEYVLALSEPEEHQVDEVPDWISGLATLGPLPCSWYVASSYDGGVRLYDASKPKLTTALASASLTSVTAMAVPESEGKASLVATGCKDGVVRCFRTALAKSEVSLGPVATLRSKEHRQSVEAVAISHDGNLVAGGGWDGDVLVWNGGPSVFEEPVGGQATSSGATKRKAESGPDLESAKYVLKGHGQVVSALGFGAPARYPFTLLSASWDGSLRVWDTAAACCVCNWSVARAVTSFSFNPTDPQVATSHEDGHVSIWDIRASPHATVAGGLSLDSSTGLPLASAQSPHRRQATQVAWCPVDSLRLATVGHDGGLCILDSRSPKMPLQRVRLGKPGPVPAKLLAVTWLSREEIAVGTSEGKVLRLELNKPKED